MALGHISTSGEAASTGDDRGRERVRVLDSGWLTLRCNCCLMISECDIYLLRLLVLCDRFTQDLSLYVLSTNSTVKIKHCSVDERLGVSVAGNISKCQPPVEHKMITSLPK